MKGKHLSVRHGVCPTLEERDTLAELKETPGFGDGVHDHVVEEVNHARLFRYAILANV